jgi:tRNA threonylcarbamoyladenosine biosynthesis protein TsaB
MMNVLGIDTSTRTTAVALAGRERTTSLPEGGHSDVLVQIDAMCREAAIAPAQLDAVAVGAGPGSFTGLRIGMATAKGIAFAVNCPLWAVSSLAALAWHARGDLTDEHADPTGEHAAIVAVLDARRGEVYAGCFELTAPRFDRAAGGAQGRAGEPALVALAPERVLPPAQLTAFVAEACGGRRTVFVGDCAPLAAPWRSATPSALGVIELALAGTRVDVLVAGAPSYIRPSEAEVKYPDGVPGALRKR